MKKNHNLAGVRTRLEDALEGLGKPASPAETWERFEMLCIAELDAFHDQFAPGILEEYLMTLLYVKQLELALLPDFQE